MAGKPPKIFPVRIPDRRFQKKILKRVHTTGDRAFLLGMYAQTLMLAMTAHGLGSCPQTALSFEANFIREALGVEPQYKLLFGISFGYPDPEAPVNRCATDRAALADCVHFHS